jgi:glucuronoarabinoxylan endo-1,4-beta-xylanase
MHKLAPALVAIALAGCSRVRSCAPELRATDSNAAGGASEGSNISTAGPIVIDFAATEQKMDGFGAACTFIDAITDAHADLFFSTTSGIGLSILRLGITPEGAIASEDSVTDLPSWGTPQKAQARNPSLRIWAAPWTPPAADKTTGNKKTGSLKPTAYASWASVLAGFVGSAKANGVNVSAISVQNEPDFETKGKYEMCRYDSNQLTSFVKVVGPALAALDPPVELIVPEPSHWQNLWGGDDYVGALMADPEAARYVGILATHQYGVPDPPSHALPPGKPLWETEVSDQSRFDAGIGNAVMIATWIHNAIVHGGVSAWHYWWLIGLNTDNEGLIGKRGDGTLTKRVYGLGNYSRFVRPGWVRLQTAGSVPGLLVSAYKDPAGRDFAIVAVNTTGRSVSASIRVDGPPFSSVSPYVTSGTPVGNLGTDGNLSQGSASAGLPTSIAASMNTFAAQVPAGITTFVGGTM